MRTKLEVRSFIPVPEIIAIAV